MDKGSVVFNGGAVDITLEYRELMPDQGLCVQVFGKAEGQDTEILRFDCFDQMPHYHYGPANHNIRLNMDKTTVGNPFGWTLDNLRTKLPAMIQRAGYEDLAAEVEANPVAAAVLDEVEAKGRQMAVGDAPHRYPQVRADAGGGCVHRGQPPHRLGIPHPAPGQHRGTGDSCPVRCGRPECGAAGL